MADAADTIAVPAGQAAISVADLNITVNHEPRVEDLKIARALGYADEQKIRTLIERHRAPLERLGTISATVAENTGKRGRPGRTFWLNKRQCLYLCTKSETANATEVTIQMVEVFDEYLRGMLPAPKTVAVRSHRRAAPHRSEPALPSLAPNQAAMRVSGELLLVDLARLEFGPEERVVCFDADGIWSVEPVRSTWPHENLNGRRFGHVRTGRPGPMGGISHRGVWIVGAVVGRLPETAADEMRQPKRIVAASKRYPRRFEAGSDIKRDLLLLIRSAKSRMDKCRALDLGRALAETLEDLIAIEDDPEASTRGAVLDWDQERATADLHRKMRAKGKDPTGCRAREVLH